MKAAVKAAVLASAVALVATGCTATSKPQAAPSPKAAASTVAVESRSVTSVLVARGTVVAAPTVLVSAPNAGVWKPNATAVQASSLAGGATLGQVGGTAIAAPVDGRVQSELIPADSSVATHTPLLEYLYSGFAISVTVPPEQLYRLYATPSTGTASITSGPAGIDCSIFPVSSQGDAGDSKSAGAAMTCLLPLDADVVPGLEAKVGIRTAQKDNVLAVPGSSVLGSTQSGLVTRIRGGKRDVVKVGLGISDGAWVEITSGLDAGDKVLANAPGLG